MIFAYTNRSLLLFIFITGFVFQAKAQRTNVNQHASMIVKTAAKSHYSPRTIDDKFAELVFNEFLGLIDPYKFYFSTNDIKQLEKYKFTIDDQIITSNCTFHEIAATLYKKKILQKDSLIQSFKTRNFQFSSKDSVYFTSKYSFLSEKDLKAEWEKIIKFQILYALLESEEDVAVPSEKKLNDTKQQIINRQLCKLKSKLNYTGGVEEYIGVCFLKAIALAFDPHTNYFTKAEEEAFDAILSKETKSFGIEFDKNDYNEIEISHIIPGSPAWKSNQLNEGDILTKVKINQSVKDCDCVDLKEISGLLNATTVSEAEFFIRKQNGKNFNLVLQKDTIDVEENVIESYLFEGKEKVGYIYLPSFYSADTKDVYSFAGCANDVAKELIKLKSEGIKGLVLDLRDNGGGSMMEAILLSGIFIDYGALSIVKQRDEQPSTLKDMNRGTIYDGPLVILVNEYSASASELFASVMQDLNRAVIVGANTFGKSTMQIIVPIDAYKYPEHSTYTGKAEGYLKVTIGAFYRVTGKSHQKTGVIPDVRLPYIIDYNTVSESSFPTALDLDTVNKKVYYYPLNPLPIDQLNKLSSQRIGKDSLFAAIKNNSDKDVEGVYLPLDFQKLKKFFEEKDNEDQIERNGNFIVKTPTYMDNVLQYNGAHKEIIGQTIDQIKKDIYLEEVYQLINNLIELK